MSRLTDNIFDNNGLLPRDPGTDAIYQASRMRDEQEVIRLLDAHRAQYGEPEQIAYANKAESRQDDPELGQFPFAAIKLDWIGGEDVPSASTPQAGSWSPSQADADALLPQHSAEQGQQEAPVQARARRI